MKIIRSITLLLITSFALAACGNNPQTNSQNSVSDNQNQQQEIKSQSELGGATENENEIVENGQGNEYGNDESEVADNSQDKVKSQQYLDYSPNAITQATQNNGRALLFFHADWCPTCRSAEKNILENIDQLPDDLTIIKVDYDSQKDLKKTYDIIYQHTFVQVDKAGNQITKWSGGELTEILKRIK